MLTIAPAAANASAMMIIRRAALGRDGAFMLELYVQPARLDHAALSIGSPSEALRRVE
jgi:hypothetical protein